MRKTRKVTRPATEIELHHRMLKQVCNIERFQVRGATAILTRIFAALISFMHLQKMHLCDAFANAYRWKRELFCEVVTSFIKSFVPGLFAGVKDAGDATEGGPEATAAYLVTQSVSMVAV